LLALLGQAKINNLRVSGNDHFEWGLSGEPVMGASV
jgi:hypothetical protein